MPERCTPTSRSPTVPGYSEAWAMALRVRHPRSKVAPLILYWSQAFSAWG